MNALQRPASYWTDERLAALEYELCRGSFDYWLSRYGWMKDESGLVIGPGIQQWPAQQEYTEAYRKGEWLIVGKTRRAGVSWLATNVDVYDMLFEDNIGLSVIAQDDPWAMFHLDRARWLYNQQPSYIKRHATPVVGKDNKHVLGLSNGSVFTAYPSTEKQARGAGAKRIRIEEFAQIDNAEAIYTAAYGAARDRGQLVLISTGRGEGGEFHKKWLQAERGEGKLRPIFLNWRCDPSRPPDFRDGMTPLERQEFPETPDEMFLASGDKYFDLQVLTWLAGQYACEPLRTEQNGELAVWHEPQRGRQYAIGADVADEGSDYCAASVRDIETNEQVARIWTKLLSAGDFGARLYALGQMYNWAYLGVERNNAGVATLDRLLQLRYPRLHYHQHYDPQAATAKPRAGWLTDKNSRPVMLGNLRDQLAGYPPPVIHEAEFYTQARQFGYYGGRPDHPPGGNDDLIFAEGICSRIIRHLHDYREPDITVYVDGRPA